MAPLQPLRSLGPLDLVRRASTATIAACALLAGALVTLAVTTEDVTQHDGLATSDPAHLRFFVDHRSASLVDVAKAITQAGAAPVLVVLAIVTGVALWWRGTRLVVAAAPAAALLGAAAVASLAKTAVGRARPPLAVRLVTETEPSFPSGHATNSAAFYVTLALVVALFVLRRPIARAVTVATGFAAAGSIGLSRLVLGVHWPTDVIAGWALGTVVAGTVVVVVAALSRRPSPAHAATPASRLVVLLHAQRRREVGVDQS